MEHYIGVLKKYAVFHGRASRMEFWMFMLFSFLISIALGIVDKYLPKVGVFGEIGILGLIYTLAVLIPSIALSVRRLHDTNRSGFWLFLLVIPFIGFLVILIFALVESTPGDNKYGPNPYGVTTSSTQTSTEIPPTSTV